MPELVSDGGDGKVRQHGTGRGAPVHVRHLCELAVVVPYRDGLPAQELASHGNSVGLIKTGKLSPPGFSAS